jgi:hypothetical protein
MSEKQNWPEEVAQPWAYSKSTTPTALALPSGKRGSHQNLYGAKPSLVQFILHMTRRHSKWHDTSTIFKTYSCHPQKTLPLRKHDKLRKSGEKEAKPIRCQRMDATVGATLPLRLGEAKTLARRRMTITYIMPERHEELKREQTRMKQRNAS